MACWNWLSCWFGLFVVTSVCCDWMLCELFSPVTPALNRKVAVFITNLPVRLEFNTQLINQLPFSCFSAQHELRSFKNLVNKSWSSSSPLYWSFFNFLLFHIQLIKNNSVTSCAVQACNVKIYMYIRPRTYIFWQSSLSFNRMWLTEFNLGYIHNPYSIGNSLSTWGQLENGFHTLRKWIFEYSYYPFDFFMYQK